MSERASNILTQRIGRERLATFEFDIVWPNGTKARRRFVGAGAADAAKAAKAWASANDARIVSGARGTK